jgi:hypothetical protein
VRAAALAFAFALSGCSPAAPPYAVCGDGLECEAPSDACYRVTLTRSDGTVGEARVCSLACTSDDECPDGGACLALEGDPTQTFFCVERCATSSECYAGLACTTVEGAAGTMRACLP